MMPWGSMSMPVGRGGRGTTRGRGSRGRGGDWSWSGSGYSGYGGYNQGYGPSGARMSRNILFFELRFLACA